MLFLLLIQMRAWLASLSPSLRRAQAKRRLEAACQRYGCTKGQALQITVAYFQPTTTTTTTTKGNNP